MISSKHATAKRSRVSRKVFINATKRQAELLKKKTNNSNNNQLKQNSGRVYFAS